MSLSKIFPMCAQKAFCTNIKVVCCVMITYKFLLLHCCERAAAILYTEFH